MIYADHATYFYECGGLTKDIMLLDNEQIRNYHSAFYHPERITLLLAGADLDPSMLDAASTALDAYRPTRTAAKHTIPRPLPRHADYRRLNRPVTTRTVPFTSMEMDVGEIGYGKVNYC
jgi:Zn-dependent M16 (insulinase) family peptidase